LVSAGLIVRVGRGDPDVLTVADALRPWWSQESLVANSCILAMLEAHAAAGRVEECFALIDEAVATLGEVWQEEWFLGRIRIATLGVMVCAAAAVGLPDAAREKLVARAEALVADGRTTVEKGLPTGRRLGVEAVAWSARLEAEWLFLRWVSGVGAPGEDEHVAAWQTSVDAFDYGNVHELTRCRVRLATVLRANGRGKEAAEQADLARTAARAMHATPLLDEIRALGATSVQGMQAKLGKHDQLGPSGLVSLTDRERDVLELLVEARTNRQIATRLYISEKTVSVHVSNILAKLGVRSRAEAAALARNAR
jgi:DNA-binding CsgD family transcriptional regulator